MGYYSKSTTFEVCVCIYELQGAQKKKLYIDIHISLKVTLGCGPTSNPKSTNTHGTQQRVSEMEQGEASGYYAWTQVLCCYILKFGLGLVTDTTSTTKRLFNWTKA